MRDRHVSGCKIDQAPWNEEWRNAPRSSFFQYDCGFGNSGKATNPGADQDTGGDLVLVAGGFPGRIVECLLRRANRKDDEVVDFALLLRLHPLIRIEAAVRAVAPRDLAGNFRRQIGDIERLDASRSALTVDQPPPRRLDAACERRDHAEPGDNHTSHAATPWPHRANIIFPRRWGAPKQSPSSDDWGPAEAAGSSSS